MSSPLSERAIQSAVALLQNIRISNGYFTDAGLHVLRARRAIEAKDLDAINVWEGAEKPANGDGSVAMQMDLELSVEGHVKASQPDTGMRLGLIKADIKRALCSASGALPDTPNRPFAAVVYTGSQPDPRHEFADSEAVTVSFSIRYAEKYGDPTTSG